MQDGFIFKFSALNLQGSDEPKPDVVDMISGVFPAPGGGTQFIRTRKPPAASDGGVARASTGNESVFICLTALCLLTIVLTGIHL